MSSHHAEEHAGHHVTPLNVYVKIIIALMILTVITVAVAYVDMGIMNAPVAMFVASLKAILVLMYFMGLKYDSKLNLAVFASSIIGLALLIGFSTTDVLARKKQMKFQEHLQIQK